MASRKGSMRRKSRNKFAKAPGLKGRVPANRMLRHFVQGDNVVLKAESSVHSGMYHPRFHGKVGIVGIERGKCVEVQIVDGAKEKTLVVHPVHLEKLRA